MGLRELTAGFLVQPHPLWEEQLGAILVKNKLDELDERGILRNGYNTINSYFKDSVDYPVVKYDLEISKYEPVFLEQPSLGYLYSFYNEHGLVPLPLGYFSSETVIAKLNNAFKLMANVPTCFSGVINLVKSIQVLKSDNEETDISYSHPEIPFSIFISLTDKDDLVSNLRVCESILHEAMHLKLTLVEEIILLVDDDTSETFYSPWRDEERPIRGVLHGLFVFRALLDFYNCLLKVNDLEAAKDFLSWRIEDILREFQSLRDFPNCVGLTKDGAILSRNLLPSS